MSIVVIDDFLPISYFNEIQHRILGVYMDWYYQDGITNNNDGDNDQFGFNHWVYRSPESMHWDHRQSDSQPLMGPHYNMCMGLFGLMMNQVGGRLLRSRFDMVTQNKEGLVHTPHIDDEQPHYSTVFYLNDSDGDTIIYNEKTTVHTAIPDTLTEKQRVTPKANRIVIFDGHYIHTGESPKNHKRRVIMNTNIKKEMK